LPSCTNPPTNNNRNDPTPVTIPDNDDDESFPMHQHYHQTNEIRRPRVSFSEFNKVQFFEENNEVSQQPTYRRHRQRSPRKATVIIANTHVSPPSIQHTQTLYRPLSRQQPVGHELNIKKQLLIPSPRVPSTRLTQLPDILNQTLPTETSMHTKYVLQREKTLFQFPEQTIEIPINSSADISRESTRAGGIRPTAAQDYYEQDNKYEIESDRKNNGSLHSNSMSSLSNRQRQSLRSISLRQQFASQIKTKPTSFTYNYQTQITNPRRSASLKNSIARNQSLNDDEHDDIQNHSLLTFENRPTTGVSSSKHLKRNIVIHLNTKAPSNGNTTIDSNERNRPHIKSNFHETSRERFQNLLNIVRPPYMTNAHISHHDSTLQPTTNHMNGSIKSSRNNSARPSQEFNMSSNTIYV